MGYTWNCPDCHERIDVYDPTGGICHECAAKRLARAESAERAVTLARSIIARLETENAELARRCATLAEIESVVARGGR